MEKKLKNISFPALLLLVASVINIKDVISSFINLFMGFWNIYSPVYLLAMLCPIVLFYFLYTKEKEKKPLGITAILWGIASVLKGILNIRSILGFEDFIEIIIYGQLYNVIAFVLIGILLLFLGIKLIKNENAPKSYYFLCGFSLFLIAYASIIMAIGNPFAILTELPTFLCVLALWYIPKLYINTEYQKTRVTSKKITTIVFLVIIMYALLGAGGGLSGSGSSSRSDIARDPNGFLGYSDDFWDWYYENSWTK